MITLQPVTKQNMEALLALSVRENQRDFVASNAESLADLQEAPKAEAFGIYADRTPVGFLLIGYDGVDYDLWRLMIDRQYQGRGYGRAALQLALVWIRSEPWGPGGRCTLSYEPDNTVAGALYHSFGFRETGEEDEGELVAALPLR